MGVWVAHMIVRGDGWLETETGCVYVTVLRKILQEIQVFSNKASTWVDRYYGRWSV